MTARKNRRTALRYARRMKVPCSLKHVIEGPAFEAFVTIVTTSAVRLVLSRPFAVGAFLAVDLPDCQGRTARQLFRVTLARSQGLCDWVVDGLLSKKLSPRDAGTAQARLTAAAGVNGWKTACRVVHVRQEGPWLTTMYDISRSGIGLISERHFNPGTFLEIALPSVQRRHLKPKLIRITHAKRHTQSDEWMLGAVFLRPLTEQELQVLL
jgi:PilZ domain